jgi:hypothetical protein
VSRGALEHARAARRGLHREAFANPSAQPWLNALVALSLRVTRELHRHNGVRKVYQALLEHARRTLTVIDLRAVSTLAEELGVSEGQVRRCLGYLVRKGRVRRAHHRGLRFPGQRGWTTNAYVLVDALPLVRLLPEPFQKGCREKLAALRDAIGEAPGLADLLGPAPAPATVENAGNATPAEPITLQACTPWASSSLQVSVGDRYLDHPLPPRGVDNSAGDVAAVRSAEGADAPLPPIAHETRQPSADTPRAETDDAPAARARGGRDDGPAPPGEASNDGGGAFRALSLRARIAHCQGNGRHRTTGQANDTAMGIGRMQKRRELERAAGKPPGRDREAARARRELRRMRRERELAGEPPDSGGE